MKFSLFEPSSRKAIKILFNKFTPEEIKILDGKDCAVPYMYSHLLKASSKVLSSNCALDEAESVLDLF